MEINNNKKMISQKSPIAEKFNLSALEQEFDSPLDGHPPCEVESSNEAKEEFDKLALDLDSKSPWKTRNDAMQHLLELLKGGIQYYPGGDLKQYAPNIAASLSDLRPVLIKTAALVVAAEAQMLEDDFIPSVDIIFPCLMKNLTHNNPSISNSCHLALLNIAKHCMNRKIAKLFLVNFNSPIPANRQLAAECTHIILETWPTQLTTLLSKDTSNVIAKLSEDPIESIQDIAISASKVVRVGGSPKRSGKKVQSSLYYKPALTCKTNPKSPNAANANNALNSPMTANSSVRDNASVRAGSVLNSPINSKISPLNSPADYQALISETTISDFMPPTTTVQAKSFKMHLDKIIESDDFSQLEFQQDVLVSSVLFTMREFPNFNEWSSTINGLFRVYKDMFSPQLIDIMSIFAFNGDIVDFAVDQTSAQELAEMLTAGGGKKPRIADAFNFFVTIFREEKYIIEITEPISNLIQYLAKLNKHNDNVQYLERAIRKSNNGFGDETDINALIEVIIGKLDRGESSWANDVELLVDSFDGTKEMGRVIERRLDEVLPDIIDKGPEVRRVNCISFISVVAPKLKKVSFKNCFGYIVASLLITENSRNSNNSVNNNADFGSEVAEKCSYYGKGIECLSKTMADIRTLCKAIVLLDHSQGAPMTAEVVLDALLRFSTEAPPQKVLAAHKTLVKKLMVFMNPPSFEDARLRHKVIAIFAECRKKIPKEFTWQMKRYFTPVQRRLVELKAGKYREKQNSY